MIEPFIQLAFNIHSSPGVFALLLGSGVSRSAEIPTGWEVMLDLIRRLANLESDDCEPDPEKWYAERYGEQPNYSSLLDRLAPTPALRQQLLRSYFEPTDEEREEGKKVPTRAHHAIASLVRSGAIRVIITTNFDRLIETALEAEGITPTVISTPDDIDGATPIVHSGCTVIKVHGDYLDTRIRNSPAELEHYDERVDRLLDRVLDEFGLIVCGWSAQYDTALRTAIRRAPSRRYPMFWAKRGSLSREANGFMKFRKASTIEIDGADDFFGQLEEKHEAIARYGEPHPLSKAAALQTLKRYLSEERFAISLHDFVKDETKNAIRHLTTADMINAHEPLSAATLTRRVRSYEQRSAVLCAIFALGTYWSGPRHAKLWADCFASIAASKHEGGTTTWLNLRLYPALLLKYAIGISAILSGKYEVLSNICYQKPLTGFKDEEFGLFLHGHDVIDHNNANVVLNFGEEKETTYRTAISELIYVIMRPIFDEILVVDEYYIRAFDKFEYLAGLIHLDLRIRKHPDLYVWLPVGAYRWRSWGRYDRTYHVANEVAAEVARDGDDWPPLQAGLFGGDLERLRAVMKTGHEWLAGDDFRSWTF